MSELNSGTMLTENALRCVAQDIELYYKKKAPNGAWCIATCRNAAAQFEQMRSELEELRRVHHDHLGDVNGKVAQPENEPLTRCKNCTRWDKSISFMGAHACAYWSPSRKEPRYTEWFEFCSFAEAKPERSEG